MKCDEFLFGMHECLDSRKPLESDPSLWRHLHHCDGCRQQWQAWQRISVALVHHTETGEATDVDRDVVSACLPERHVVPLLGWGLALAGLFLMAVLGSQIGSSLAPTGNAPTAGSQLLPSVPQLSASAENGPVAEIPSDAAQWWYQVQPQDWLAQTMPTVHWVREGVAPLGRSLLQAVSILTSGVGEGAS